MTDRAKKLENLLAKARELNEVEDLSPEQSTELEATMVESKSLMAKIATEKTIDEFTASISKDAPADAARKSAEVLLGTSLERYGVYAGRKDFEGAVKAWKSGNAKDAQWGFDLRYKAVDAGVTAEVNAGALDFNGTTDGEQYSGAVAPYYYKQAA